MSVLAFTRRRSANRPGRAGTDVIVHPVVHSIDGRTAPFRSIELAGTVIGTARCARDFERLCRAGGISDVTATELRVHWRGGGPGHWG
ncbi:hypothetical protein GXW83_14905 [Streptacidiphilus sp. PB12-B1b]|uniref:hypothetical protein n=1 Tax=Streptacidiphilus sp. PB12-B1b TaxID=2705012 RepID=UPI0015FA7743|nr:hypothetical protein [Streptacidiphilus sp. PB12-B1b]QMU76833.1 hypothetical protein GXW83_14905 [Streptacidiphilus sp. PB12-B1b]